MSAAWGPGFWPVSAAVDKCERDHAAVIGLDAKSWDARFERKRWSTRADWAELRDNELLHHAASCLGFDQFNWPPRNDVKLHTVPQLQRWLKCRDTSTSDGSSKALNASQLQARVSPPAETPATGSAQVSAGGDICSWKRACLRRRRHSGCTASCTA